MARAGKSRLRSSGLRAAADDLGRGQKLRAAAGQGAALAGALPENLLTRRPQARHAPARFSFAAPAPPLTRSALSVRSGKRAQFARPLKNGHLSILTALRETAH